MGLSMGTVYATWKDTSLLWFSLVLLYFTLRMLLREQPAWKRFLLLILLPVFWLPWDGRTILNIFLFVLFLKGWYGVREGQFKPVVQGCIAAVLCAAAFLYSADAGIYAIAALLLALAGVAWEGRWAPQAFQRYAVALLVFAALSVALVFAINAAMTKPLDFRYWKSSVAIVNLHRWKESAPMTDDGIIRLLVALIAGGGGFCIRLCCGYHAKRAGAVRRPAHRLRHLSYGVFRQRDFVFLRLVHPVCRCGASNGCMFRPVDPAQHRIPAIDDSVPLAAMAESSMAGIRCW